MPKNIKPFAKIPSDDVIKGINPPEGYEPIVSNSPFGWRSGPLFEKKTTDGWLRGFRVLENHCNVGGFCHGGMIMTFADIVMSRAVLEKADRPFVTVRMVTDFTGPAALGDWVTGHARICGLEGSLVSLNGEICVDNTPIAGLNAVFKIMGSNTRVQS
ncbi:thioesterase [Kordiimonas sediminis]|uniref:Thioesterase n=1 Tax=Kordiimonas sediminis TaxID=1735581 RepID=A0A919AVC6_9PROT|nr:PaaI family thioesterase [Kordiimonas sediminis]GHF25331.1 thioesterase [Kordiimonas sediminis]